MGENSSEYSKALVRFCSVLSETTLITGGLGGRGVDPPMYKKSLTLIDPYLNNFQLNGAKNVF